MQSAHPIGRQNQACKPRRLQPTLHGFKSAVEAGLLCCWQPLAAPCDEISLGQVTCDTTTPCWPSILYKHGSTCSCTKGRLLWPPNNYVDRLPTAKVGSSVAPSSQPPHNQYLHLHHAFKAPGRLGNRSLPQQNASRAPDLTAVRRGYGPAGAPTLQTAFNTKLS